MSITFTLPIQQFFLPTYYRVFFLLGLPKKVKVWNWSPPNTKIWLSPILVLPQQVINLSKTCFKLV